MANDITGTRPAAKTSPIGLVSLFFPMWNEQETIHRTVAAAQEAGLRLIERSEVSDFEILLIDDASTDATADIAEQLASTEPRIRVIHHETNRGLGGGLKTGFAEARGDVVLYTDADLPFDLLDIVKAMRLLRIYEADIVSAYRLDRTGEGPRRVVYSYLYNHLTRLTLGLRVRDVNFAFKLVRRTVLDHLTLSSEGSFIDVELLAKAERMGYRIVQFGVDYFPRTRGVSTLSSLAVIRTLLREMRQLVPEIRRTQALAPHDRSPD